MNPRASEPTHLFHQQVMSVPPVATGNLDENLIRSERMLQVAYNALAFVEEHGYETYDISDAKGTPLVLWTYAHGGWFARLLRLALYGGLYIAPIRFRKLLRVRPSRYAHASAMLACAYIELYKITGERQYSERAGSLLEWLSQNTAQAPVGSCWGAPFPWFSYGGVVPVGVGSSHGTIWAANAFLGQFETTRNQFALDQCVQACDFLAFGLNSTRHASGSLSVSYSVLDCSQCLNINADAASVLLRLSKLITKPAYYQSGVGMLQFVIENQNRDGSWSYDVPLQGKASTNIDGRPWSPNIDGFHTGMVLSALCWALPAVVDSDLHRSCKAGLEKGARFYMGNLFTADGKPRYSLKSFYPIDPYSCGQAMISLLDICQCRVLDFDLRQRAALLVAGVADFTIESMLEPDGSFLTARYRFRAIRLKSLRWAQAVLSLAYVRYGGFLLTQLRADGHPS